jgi:hypothetical protein
LSYLHVALERFHWLHQLMLNTAKTRENRLGAAAVAPQGTLLIK